MQNAWEAIRQMISEARPNLLESIGELDEEKRLQVIADADNNTEGHLSGVECDKCKNKGYEMIVKDGKLICRLCECQGARKSLERIERSGLKTLIDKMTFDKYEATEPWQKHALSMAKDFVENGGDKWLFFGGQSGSGKSFLCTAVCGELIKRKNAVRYMMWDAESKKLKSIVNEKDEYQRYMDELKSVKVLYIDDFLKVQRGQQPTPADINLAFEIINHRDFKGLKTIISSEKTIDDIIALDEALGGRINMRSRGFQMNIALDKNKNYRLRK